MPRGIIYVRVSSDEQVQGMSLDFQKADCLAYAAKRGIEVERVFEERGESAKVASRPELIRLLDYCKGRRSLDALIVWKLDRLSRNQLDYYYLKRTLLDRGIALHSATEPSVDDPNSIAGKVFETFSALQAEIDNTMRSERTRRGMGARIAMGIYPWRPPPGYRPASERKPGEKKRIADEPDPATFPILQRGLREYAGGAVSLSDLAARLDAMGFGAIRGYPTRHQFARVMLFDFLDFYAGRLKNPWTGEECKGAHLPMLDEREWHRIIAVRDGRSVRMGQIKRRDNPEFPLKMTLLCTGCGKHPTGSFSTGRTTRVGYYHCRNKACPLYGKGLRKLEVEDAFEKLAEAHRLRPEFLARLEAILREEVGALAGEALQKATRLAARLSDLERRRDRIFDMREEGSYTKGEFEERRRAVDAEIATIHGETAGGGDPEREIGATLDLVFDFLGRMGVGWRAMDDDLKRRFQLLLFPEGISYDRKQGVGTAIPSLIFGLNRRFQEEDTLDVPLAPTGWNHLLDHLTTLARDWGRRSPA